jgi:hypothetical protein
LIVVDVCGRFGGDAVDSVEDDGDDEGNLNKIWDLESGFR